VVELAPAAARELRRLPPVESARTRGPILALAYEPRPPGVRKVSGSGLWRLRIGQLRVIYLVDDVGRTVIVVRVARRSESTYRGV
jgi:mRNA interferase RelE/StbE